MNLKHAARFNDIPKASNLLNSPGLTMADIKQAVREVDYTNGDKMMDRLGRALAQLEAEELTRITTTRKPTKRATI